MMPVRRILPRISERCIVGSARVKRQHTVSKFYLDGFADGRDMVARVEIPDRRSIVQSISRASVVRDFYSVELGDGSLSDFFEKAMSEVEGPASKALRSIMVDPKPPQSEQRSALSSWIALQHLRGEAPRESQTSMSAEMYRHVVGVTGKRALRGHIESSLGRSISDAELDYEWRDITKPGGPDLEPNTKLHIQNIMSLWPQMAEYLECSHWTMVCFSRKALVTSDTPVALSVGDDYPEHMGVGIFTADMFTVPLTRRLALNIQPREVLEQQGYSPSAPDFKVKGTTMFANSINQQTVWQARRYVYHHPEDEIDCRIEFPARSLTSGSVAFTAHDYPEEGWFADGVQIPGPRPVGGVDGAVSSGFSLSDLPWPIPRRKKRC